MRMSSERRCAVSLLACCLAVSACVGTQAGEPQDLEALRARLSAQVHGWVRAGEMARPDGFVYGVDVGQLVIHAARARDVALYDELTRFVREHLIMDGEKTRGMVRWRWRADARPDASGTTEALRVAQGLWLGAEAFSRPADRELALLVLGAYAGHAKVDQGIWFIANYYNFWSQAFATNSYLVDYDPDFVAEVATATGDARLAEVAAKSRELVTRAVSDVGLLYDLIQPEIVTLMPWYDRVVFSPNDVVQLANACTVAERSAGVLPEVARGVLAFAVARSGRLRLAYYGRDGSPASDQFAGAETLACLTRLAVWVGDAGARRLMQERFASLAAVYARQPNEPRLYMMGELLLALDAVLPTPARAERGAAPDR